MLAAHFDMLLGNRGRPEYYMLYIVVWSFQTALAEASAPLVFFECKRRHVRAYTQRVYNRSMPGQAARHEWDDICRFASLQRFHENASIDAAIWRLFSYEGWPSPLSLWFSSSRDADYATHMMRDAYDDDDHWARSRRLSPQCRRASWWWPRLFRHTVSVMRRRADKVSPCENAQQSRLDISRAGTWQGGFALIIFTSHILFPDIDVFPNDIPFTLRAPPRNY